MSLSLSNFLINKNFEAKENNPKKYPYYKKEIKNFD